MQQIDDTKGWKMSKVPK